MGITHNHSRSFFGNATVTSMTVGMQKIKEYLWPGMTRNHPTRKKRIEMDCWGRLSLRNERPRGILSKGNTNTGTRIYLEQSMSILWPSYPKRKPSFRPLHPHCIRSPPVNHLSEPLFQYQSLYSSNTYLT